MFLASSGIGSSEPRISRRRRSSATHRPSRVSLTPNSRATSAIVRPESITRSAALHSVVNDRRVQDMVTSFQRVRAKERSQPVALVVWCTGFQRLDYGPRVSLDSGFGVEWPAGGVNVCGGGSRTLEAAIRRQHLAGRGLDRPAVTATRRRGIGTEFLETSGPGPSPLAKRKRGAASF
jgi:hypothetical protein